MGYKRRIAFGMSIVITMVIALMPLVSCEESGFFLASSRYTHTQDIRAALTLKDGKAYCHGSVAPIATQNCTVTVTLYKQNGSNWSSIKSWTGSAEGGLRAFVTESTSINVGTYKVIAVGNVAGEITSAETSPKTY